MTTYQPKPIQGKYDPNYDPRSKTISVGVSLVSVETETILQDNKALELPVDDEVIYLSIPRELSNDWEAIALQAEGNGYLRRHWKVVGVWEAVAQHIADDIF